LWPAAGFAYSYSFPAKEFQIGNLKSTAGETINIAEKVLEDADNVQNINLRSRGIRYRFLSDKSKKRILGAVGRSQELSTGVLHSIDDFFVKIKLGLELVFRGFQDTILSIKKAPRETGYKLPQVEEGTIVFPSAGEKTVDAETLARLRGTFSDEVVVVPGESGDTGFIQPVFKKRDDQGGYYLGDKYVYLLVPVPPSTTR